MKRKTADLIFEDTSEEENLEPVLKKRGRPSYSSQPIAKKVAVSAKKNVASSKKKINDNSIKILGKFTSRKI
jgi:hypothetical protein